MKLGDYVRTKKGTIYQFNSTSNKALSGAKKYMVKSSPSIIDLIEIGDYVNGYKVSFVDEEPVMGNFVQCDYEVPFGTTNHYRFYKADIKSIVTHEQFSQMEYRIGK